MIYDCRKDGRNPASVLFPCRVKIVNPVTGERIANVFFAQTAPAKLGRFIVGPEGEPMVNASSRRQVRYTDPDDGREKVKIVYDRLEVWDHRPWVAVSLDTGEVIAKSEGCS